MKWLERSAVAFVLAFAFLAVILGAAEDLLLEFLVIHKSGCL
jgi:hypothetical protein